MIRFKLAFVLLLVAMPCWATDPPVPPATTIPAKMASIAARRAQLQKLIDEDKAEIAELSKQVDAQRAELAKLGIASSPITIEPFAIGKPGKDGHSPVVAFGTGGDADRLTVDGKVVGPHLTGPQGIQGIPGTPGPPAPTPPTPTDAFTATLQSAYTADVGADKSASLAFLTTAYKAMASNPKAGLATNGDASGWMKSVVEAPGVGLSLTQLTALRHAIAMEKASTMGTDAAKALDGVKFVFELSKCATALGGVK